MANKIYDYAFAEDSFGNSLHDEVLQFRLDNQVVSSMRIKLENNKAYFTLLSPSGKILNDPASDCFSLLGDRGELLAVTLGTNQEGVRGLRFLYEKAELFCSLEDIYEKTDVIDAEVNAETMARISADEAETSARIAADETETNARIAADETETRARIAADEALTSIIDSERAERMASCNVLSNRISALEGVHLYRHLLKIESEYGGNRAYLSFEALLERQDAITVDDLSAISGHTYVSTGNAMADNGTRTGIMQVTINGRNCRGINSNNDSFS